MAAMTSNVTYAMMASGKSVDPTEVERSDADVVDVTFSWGEPGERNVLGVRHLKANEGLAIGEDEGADLFVPAAVLGCATTKVLSRTGDRAIISVPAGAKLKVDGWPRK